MSMWVHLHTCHLKSRIIGCASCGVHGRRGGAYLVHIYIVFRHICVVVKQRLLALSCLSIGPSIHMSQHRFHWTDFCEIWYWGLYENHLRKSKFDWIQGKNIRHFTVRPEYSWLLLAPLSCHTVGLLEWHGIMLVGYKHYLHALLPYVICTLSVLLIQWKSKKSFPCTVC